MLSAEVDGDPCSEGRRKRLPTRDPLEVRVVDRELMHAGGGLGVLAGEEEREERTDGSEELHRATPTRGVDSLLYSGVIVPKHNR